MRISILTLLTFTFLSLNSCSGTYKHILEFSPYERLRIAVLPFRQVNEKGELTEESGDLLIDEVPLVSSELKDSPTSLTRQLVLAELKKTPLEIISTALIDIDLPHRNLAHPDGKFNLDRIFEVPATTYCEDFLDCDAVLFGTVRKWNRDYYGVQSNNEVEIELKLISGKSNKVLFQSSATDSEGRGLAKGPTGYSSILLEPIKGLDSSLIEDLARRIISKMLSPLKVKRSQNETPPPAIFAASHDATNGSLNRDKPLTVLVLGTKELTASFSLGTYLRNLPMIEQSPGHYIGEYWPLEGESFSNLPVIVSLKDSEGRATKLEVDNGLISLK